MQSKLRNFCIIAHIDHGKSTLADRLLEHTGTLTHREMTDQVLDSMDLERERGITIKMQAVRLSYQAKDGQEYILNLIDTPGHVDFSYEVSRSLAACEGALLVIDASQGVEAQTLANLYLALENDLEIIPVINKIDLPSADPERIKEQLAEIGLDPAEAILASAKTGVGIEGILEAVVQRIPAPAGDLSAPLQALIFDSEYDSYRGVLAYIRVIQGQVKADDQIIFMATQKDFAVDGLGVFRPKLLPVDSLKAGEVGCLISGVKNVKDVRVGDTITLVDSPATQPLPGYRRAVPMVFSGLYPVDNDTYGDLREALEKLQLNDAALEFEPESSVALGFGFRCGFLGLLHMDIIQERLEREYGLDIITTAPSVRYQVRKTDEEELTVDNPALLPQPQEIEVVYEPYVRGSIIVPQDFVGPVMELAQDKRGIFITMEYLDSSRVRLLYDLPLGEIIMDFFDKLKSRTKGYASFDYHYDGYRESAMVKLDILVNNRPVDALSSIVHQDKAYNRGRELAKKLKEIIPRQLFEVPIQASIGNKIIARETISAMRKDVLAKCYGGDISRKRKLLEKQREGKRRMKSLGNVDIPQEAFMAVLKSDE